MYEHSSKKAKKQCYWCTNIVNRLRGSDNKGKGRGGEDSEGEGGKTSTRSLGRQVKTVSTTQATSLKQLAASGPRCTPPRREHHSSLEAPFGRRLILYIKGSEGSLLPSVGG